MDTRQRFLELRKIFNEVIEAEVRKYFSKCSGEHGQQLDSEKSKITFYNIKGDMIFLDKYELIGDGDGGNEMISQVNGGNSSNEAPTFIIPDDSPEMCKFLLHLEHPFYEDFDDSYFCKESHDDARIYRLDCEDMLENAEFKKVIQQMFEDIAPKRAEEIKHLIA